MDEELLHLINSKNYKLLGTGYVSKAYEIILSRKKYILLQGQIKDSYKYYSFSYNNLIFLNNNGNPYIKSIKFPNEDLNLIKPINDNEFFKNGALMYKIIQGIIFSEKYLNKINRDNITTSISKFLIELYNIPLDTNPNKIKEYRQSQIKVLTRNLDNIKKYLNNKNVEKLETFGEEYYEYISKFEDFHYTHGDFWQENLIISDDYQNLIGVIDFDNFGINDIARDYASLFNLGYDFINIIIDKSSEIIKDRNDFMKRIKIYEKFIIIGCLAFIIINNKNKKDRIEIHLNQLKKNDLI